MGILCPGSQAIKNPTPEEIACPFCKAAVEIWTDESRARCRNCGTVVTREMTLGCIEWCPKAAQCIGQDKLAEYRNSHKEARS